jgi:serine/threonine protein kinase
MSDSEIFRAAIKLPVHERGAYLAQACGDNQALRQEVESLLQAHEADGSFLAQVDSATGLTMMLALPTERVGSIIGPYKLLQQIGEGGMGTVFLAEQSQPVQRKVAFKIIKPGMDSRQVIARFEAERQALALMDHPNIAKVLDAGTTDGGRPYFVMELVKGVPITKYCDERRLTPEERLKLFVAVCHAVQHAHQKGIIHRDLKPSNVMVCLYDGKPVPKVIDFGVAKATGQRLTERTLFTDLGQVVGTLEYMSPEQAELNQLDVDTRSDIYSLGVLLYELLTGTTPLERKRFEAVAFLEVLRLIREEEPQKPSTRLSTTEALPSIAANRGLEPKKLSGMVRGDLDWIAMKCLEKDRNRRYETANAFAEDLQRYLADEPVRACPPSAAYRFRKFARRNKAPLLVGLALLVLLVMGTVGTSIGLASALRAKGEASKAAAAETRQRRRAETERDKALTAEIKAVKEKNRANDATEVANSIVDFLHHDLLMQANPEESARAKKVTVEEVLDRAAARVAEKFKNRPNYEAGNRMAIGTAYRQLGNYPAARQQFELAYEYFRRASGEENRNALLAKAELGSIYWIQGQTQKAESFLVEVIEMRRRVMGEEHSATLQAMNNLGLIYRDRRELDRAEALFAKTLEASRRALGEEHPTTLACTNNLADIYLSKGQVVKAMPLLVKTLEANRRIHGDEHPDTLSSMNNLGSAYHDQGRMDLATPLFEKTLELRRHVLGDEHRQTLASMNDLAAVYLEQKQNPKAESLLRQALEICRRVHGEENRETLRTINNLAGFYHKSDQFLKAEPLFRELLDKTRRSGGDPARPIATVLHALGVNLNKQNKYTEAEPLLRECLAIRERESPDDWSTFNTKSQLGESLLGQKNFTEAERLLVSSYESLAEREPKIPSANRGRLTRIADQIVQLYDATGQAEKAAEWRKVLEARKAAATKKEN